MNGRWRSPGEAMITQGRDDADDQADGPAEQRGDACLSCHQPAAGRRRRSDRSQYREVKTGVRRGQCGGYRRDAEAEEQRYQQQCQNDDV